MLSDPLNIHFDSNGAAVTVRGYRRLPSAKSNETLYKSVTDDVAHAEQLIISHNLTGSAKTGGVRRRTKVELLAYQVDPEDSTKDRHDLAPIRIMLVADVPLTAKQYSSVRLQNVIRQFTGMIRGNSVNDTDNSVDFTNFIDRVLDGEA